MVLQKEEPREWTHSQPTHIAEMEKCVWERALRVWSSISSIREIGVCLHHGFHHQPQQESHQFELRRKKMGRMKEDQMVEFWHFAVMNYRNI